MLKEIDVRFFLDDGDDFREIDHDKFVEIYAMAPDSRVDVEKHSVSANGVRQLCITLIEVP